jgi:hypothetical protein
VRLILSQPSRDRRTTILALLDRRPEYASSQAVKAAVELAYASHSLSRRKP